MLCRYTSQGSLATRIQVKGRGQECPPHTVQRSRMTKVLARAAGNGGHQQHFIPILKSVGLPAQKADVFFIHIHV